MAAPSTGTQECRLLNTPGELRDRIYQFCQEEHVMLNDADKPAQRLSFLSLTQTCRQIRSEFRPLYMNHTTVELSAESSDPIELFAEIFYPTAEAHIMAAYRGNLQLIVDGWNGNNQYPGIHKIVALLFVAPQIEVRFIAHFSFPLAEPAVDQINELFCYTASPKNDVWRDAFKRMGYILVHFSDYGHRLIFETDRATACNAHAWWKEAGLPIMGAFKIRFEWRDEGDIRAGHVQWNVCD